MRIRLLRALACLWTGIVVLEAGTRGDEFSRERLELPRSYPRMVREEDLIGARIELSGMIEPVGQTLRLDDASGIDTVILDPGHGGKDLGAKTPFKRVRSESYYTMDVARRARKLLTKSGFQVHLTREEDVFVSLDERAEFASGFENAVLVSIHFNWGFFRAEGVETYVLSPRGVPSTNDAWARAHYDEDDGDRPQGEDAPNVSESEWYVGNFHDASNRVLGAEAHAAMLRGLKCRDRNIKRARFAVLRNITIPGVLIEGGFMSNPFDRRRIARAAYRQRLAAAIADGIGRYRETGRSGLAALSVGAMMNWQAPPEPPPPFSEARAAGEKVSLPDSRPATN